MPFYSYPAAYTHAYTFENHPKPVRSKPRDVSVVVIGGGWAGLSVAAELTRAGFRGYEEPGTGKHKKPKKKPNFIVLDANPLPGGAWQHCWESVRTERIEAMIGLPGFPFGESFSPAEREAAASAPASRVVPFYCADVEASLDVPVMRPVYVDSVTNDPNDRALLIHTTAGTWRTKILVNATGSWTRPFVPYIRGAAEFRGRQFHSGNLPPLYQLDFKRVVVIGAEPEAGAHLLDIAPVVSSYRWVIPGKIDDAVRNSLTPDIAHALELGALHALPMFDRLTPYGPAWGEDVYDADVLILATGFRPELRHLRGLGLRTERGRIPRENCRIVADPRIYLVGVPERLRPDDAPVPVLAPTDPFITRDHHAFDAGAVVSDIIQRNGWL